MHRTEQGESSRVRSAEPRKMRSLLSLRQVVKMSLTLLGELGTRNWLKCKWGKKICQISSELK